MAIKLPFKLDVKTVTLFISLLLNLLGGTSTIQPVIGAPECTAPVAEPAPPPPPLPKPTPAPATPAAE